MKSTSESLQRNGARWIGERKDKFVSMIETGWTDSAMYQQLEEDGDAPPFKLRQFNTHMSRLRSEIVRADKATETSVLRTEEDQGKKDVVRPQAGSDYSYREQHMRGREQSIDDLVGD